MPHLDSDRHPLDGTRLQPDCDAAADPEADLTGVVPNCRAPARQISHRIGLETLVGHHGQANTGGLRQGLAIVVASREPLNRPWLAEICQHPGSGLSVMREKKTRLSVSKR